MPTKLLRHFSDMLAIDLRFFRSRICTFCFNLIPDFYTLSPLRNLFLRLGGARVSLLHAYVRSPFWCADLQGLSLGKGVFINMGCRFEGTAPIIIGDSCQIGPFCCFENVNHIESGDQFLPVQIGSGVWIGARAVFTPGSVVGDNAVIAAGAVVVKEIPAGELWGGVPAKRIKALPVRNP